MPHSARNSNDIPTYRDAGFNGFFRRTLGSTPEATTLRELPALSYNLHFDDQQTSGQVGDIFRVGQAVSVDGKVGRVAVVDEQGNPVVWLGDVQAP